ncbi:MAG: hypothetical protein WC260_01500 [Candidatus Pacearchaeota archaeon]
MSFLEYLDDLEDDPDEITISEARKILNTARNEYLKDVKIVL